MNPMRRLLHNPVRDFRYVFRQLRKAPGFTLTAISTLALGIGASSAIFCLIEGLWLQPMPVRDQAELVRVFSTTAQNPDGYFTYLDFLAFAQRASAFKGLAAIGRRGSLMPRPDGTSAVLLTNVVSSNFFDLLGVRPILGRAFTSKDADRLRVRPGALLSYRCWQQNFGGDPNIVGKQIPLRRGRDHINQIDVWGVLPPQFREIDANSDRDLWMPTETWALVTNPAELKSRTFRWFNLIGRLAPGASVNVANSQVASIAGALAAADPSDNRGWSARAVSDSKYRLDRAGTTGIVLFAIVGGVVLLCTVNVAHLLLARALSRGPEVALRISLGATRLAVARQLLIENLLLCALGWAAGLVVATGIVQALPRLVVSGPEMLIPLGARPSFQLDWRVFLLAGSLALATMLLLALVPLLEVAHPQLVPALQRSGQAVSRRPALRRTAIWLQVGVSFALLVSTGTLVQSFLNTRTRPIGLTRNQLIVAFTQDPDAPLRDTVLENLRTLPGAASAAYAIRSPLMPSEGGIAAKILLPGHPEMRDPVEIKYNAVSPGFLNVIGTRLLRGRGFTPGDDHDGPPVVLVNQAMMKKFWPAENPIGQVVRLPAFNNGADLDARVIGVTEDAPINQMGEIPEPYFYLPFHLSQLGEVTFVVETRQNAMALAKDARQVFVRVNPLLDPMFITSLPELIRASAGEYQMMAELVSALGLIGLLLTMVGLYGFLAFRVTQRSREIGIRMALGASRQATTMLVFADGAKTGAVGLAIGFVLAALVTRLERSVLFGVNPLDPVSIIGALILLSLAALGASWMPAHRAASLEPVQALRTE
jgi:predicted permease